MNEQTGKLSMILVRHLGFQTCSRLLFLMTSWSFVLQASALEERLHKTEVELKENREEAQKNIQQLNDDNSQLVSYALFF